MILECSCGKMFRVRDEAANPPSKCPACGGALRRAGAAPAAVEADPRLSELSSALARSTELLQAREREISEARERVASLEVELAEARRSIAKLGEDQARAQKAHLEALQAKEEDLVQARSRADQLGEAPSRVLALQAELAEARQCIAKLGDDQAGAQAAHLEAIRSKDSEIEGLAARVRSLERRVEEARGAEPLEGRVAELEDELSRVLASLERETAERRRAEEHASKLVTEQARTIEDKEAIIATLEATLATRAAAGAAPGPVSPSEVAGALHLASEVDRSLDSMAAQLGALRERVKRVGECLGRAGAAAPSPAGSVPASPAAVASDVPAIQAAEPEEPEKLALPADESLLDMSGIAQKVREAISGKTETAGPPPLISPPPAGEEVSFSEVEPGQAQAADPVPSEGHGEPPKAPDEAQGKKGFFKKLFGK
jgi:hypothetical protein